MRAGSALRMPRITAIAAMAALTMIVVGLPAATTGAHLTASDTATGAAGVGNWCSVPNPTVSKNVYKLSDFTAISAPEAANNGTTSAVKMLIIPVVNDGSFDPIEPLPAQVSAVDNQLGVRLWSCTPTMSTTQSIKLTAWRGNYAAPNASSFAWDVAPSASVSFAEARLKSTSTLSVNTPTSSSTLPGVELRDLHRNINKLGGVTGGTDPVTMRYSWMLTSGRTEGASYTSDPACASKTCHVDGASGVTDYNSVFSGIDTAAAVNAVSKNSTTYLAEKYYSSTGAWPTTSTTTNQLQCSTRTRTRQWDQRNQEWDYGTWSSWSSYVNATGTNCGTNSSTVEYRSQTVPITGVADAAPTVAPTVLDPKGTSTNDALLRDTTGTKIQYVVLEWWGTGTPPADLEVEVFVK